MQYIPLALGIAVALVSLPFWVRERRARRKANGFLAVDRALRDATDNHDDPEPRP